MTGKFLTVLILLHQFFGFYSIDYKNANLWKNDFPQCGENHQSPININLKSTKKYFFKTLTLKNHDIVPKEMTLLNDGNSVKLTAKWPTDKVPSVSFGYFEAPYLFDNIHFHWGQSNSRGSEHTFNGERFPLEMHLVHYKSSYGSVSKALNKSDGIVVIGVIFQIMPDYDCEIQPIVRNLSLVTEKSKGVKINPFSLSIFKLKKENYYITYRGSLTTPPCSESVKWLLAKNLHGVSKTQMKAFRHIELDHGGKENFRPIQPLNGRSYYYIRVKK